MNHDRKYLSSSLFVVVALLSAASFNAALAATAPPMGSAASFAVLGSSTVTCTGPSVITGNLGVSPGSAVTGFPVPCTVAGGGAIYSAEAVALQAQLDAQTAYNDLVFEPCTTDLTGQDLGGLTLGPGVYCFSSSAQLTGTLNLTGGGPWIFQIGSTLTTASASSVLVNGKGISNGCAPGVFWAVGSSATLGTTTQFQGVILAVASDTLTTGANVSGGVFALNGAVTLDSNHVSTCNNASGGGSQCTFLHPSSIGSNFNGTSIPAGDFIWFSANASIKGIPTSGPDQTVSVTNQIITVPGLGSFDVPASEVTFSSTYTCASVSFNTVTGTWEVHVPFSGSDEILIGGFTLPVPASIPGGIKGVTWSGTFASTAASASVDWRWGAAVYTTFTTDYNALKVKPTHQNACSLNNGDHAGTPEGSSLTGASWSRFAIGGATGGGGGNATGSWSGTATACR
jgi:Ice-binding-like